MPFYSNEKIEQQLDLLHHMLQFGDELLLVSGKEGVGKSRQLHELMHRLGEGWQICQLSGKDNSQISQLFEQVSQSFGYDYSTVSSAELLSGFQHHLEQKEAGKTYALLIDDAEFLDEGTLEVVTHLSQLQNDKGFLLRVVLFGDQTLSDAPILKTVPLREVTIEPLDSQQSQSYIDFCIEQGRYAIEQSPSLAQQQQIVKRAEGLPGQIEAMLQNGSRPIDGWKKILDWRVAAVLLLLLAAGMGYLLNSGSETPSTITEPASKSDQLTALQQPVIGKSIMVTTTDAPSVVVQQEAEEALISELLKQDESMTADMSTSAVNKKSADGTRTESDDGSTEVAATGVPIQSTPIVGTVENGGSLIEVPGEIMSEVPAETKLDILEVAVDKGRVGDRAWLQSQAATSFTIQLVAAGREAALDEMIRREQLQGDLARFSFVRDGRIIHVLTQGVYIERSGAEEAVKRYSLGVRPWIRSIADIHRLFTDNPPPVVKAAPAPTPTVSATVTAGIKDSAWIWSQDPEMITIQLMAGSNRQLLQSYVSLSLKSGMTAILESKREAKPWYILLHGRYSSREEAHSAVAKLPQQLLSAKPWIRSFASVHDELSQTN